MGNPWNMRRVAAQAAQPWRPGNAIEAFTGNPYAFDQNATQRLRTPLDQTQPRMPGQAAPVNVPISWISQTFNSNATENIISAQPNRVILVIQNLSPTTPIAVNFDLTASVSGASPNYVSQGIMLLPGVSLFIDKWCPTGTVHVSAANAPAVVTQGFSSIGNVPFIET